MRNVAIAFVLGALPLLGGAPGTASSPRGDVSTIPLVDQNDAAFTLRDLRGHPLVLTFVATRCTDACPIANAVFAQLQRDLQERRLDARLATVTLDPRYDTPFVLARTARELGADAALWRFGGGNVRDVERVLADFGVVTALNERGVPDVHSTYVYVLDRAGNLSRTLLLSTAIRRELLDLLAADGAQPSAASASRLRSSSRR
jgi:cytochrome oxidase Cu insertion factor (SCO1/SenC/PrrC family)